MPKIPNKIRPVAPAIPLRFVADEIERIKSDLVDAQKRLDHLYVSLFTAGLRERGPLTETKDDVPF